MFCWNYRLCPWKLVNILIFLRNLNKLRTLFSAPSDILCELIEVLIHNILYARKVYPDTIFSRRRKYGIPVFQCIQPDVNNYINEALKAVFFHTKKNQLKNIFLCFQSGGSVSEKYVFDVVDLKSIDERLVHIPHCGFEFSFVVSITKNAVLYLFLSFQRSSTS